jgi:carotenoid cleavage oxygenase
MSDVTGSRWLEGYYAPVREEVTAIDLPVTGQIPDALNGRYLRNGPNPLAPPDPATYHWFTGDAMVHGVRLRDGRAEWYRNRWVRSTAVSEALGEPPAPGERHGGFDTANTNVIGLAGTTLALVEAGARPVELSYELDTICHTDLDGTLPTAHPKVDPATGDLHAVCYHWALPHLQYVVIGPEGRVKQVEPVEVPGGPMVHDMSITERWAVVYDLPVTFDLESAMGGERLPYRWDDDYGARLGLVPLGGSGSDVRWFDVEPCYVFHPLNAHDDGESVVIDVVRHPRMFDQDRTGPRDGTPSLWRWTVDTAGGKVVEEQLDDRAIEFPRVDERLVGRRHRWGYAAAISLGERADDDSASSLVRYDADTGAAETHDFGPGRSTGEGVFVPAADDAPEGDGWVMALVHDSRRDRSDLVVLSADDFSGEPVARVELPARVPAGFHGNWVPD